MISFRELLSGNQINDLPIKHQQNLQELCKAMNIIREAYGQPMIVTSGYRSLAQHKRIYSEKKITKVPMGSAHLTGEACDIFDPQGKLKEWVLNNVDMLEKLNLYCEDFESTKNWTHFQSRAPKSGNRFFKP